MVILINVLGMTGGTLILVYLLGAVILVLALLRSLIIPLSEMYEFRKRMVIISGAVALLTTAATAPVVLVPMIFLTGLLSSAIDQFV